MIDIDITGEHAFTAGALADGVDGRLKQFGESKGAIGFTVIGNVGARGRMSPK